MEEDIKANFKKLANDFMKDLFEISDFDPNNGKFENMKSDINGSYKEFRS